MQKKYISKNLAETKKLASQLISEVAKRKSQKEATIFCLSGELGAGKTSFAQGILKELGTPGPYTSPTFLIMKQYELENRKYNLEIAYHFDAYRVGVSDILSLGWEEIIADPANMVIIEWAEKVEKIMPHSALWFDFEWAGDKERKIKIRNQNFLGKS